MGYGDGPGEEETQVMDCQGPRGRSGKAKKRETELRDQHANVPTYKCPQRRYFNQLEGAQQEKL